MNAIVVHANLGFLLSGGVAGVVFERVVLTCNTHGVAPRGNDVCHIAFWHSDGVGCGYSHALKANFCCRAHAQSCATRKGGSTAYGAEWCEKAAGQCTQTTAQDLTACWIGNIVNAKVRRAVAVFHQGEVF